MVKLINYKNIKPAYYIFSDGRVWSKYKKGFMKPKKHKDGYLFLSLVTPNKNKDRQVYISTLVNVHFNGLPPINMKDPTTDHIDSNIENNNYINLQWLTRQENIAKRNRTGRTILTEEIIHKICKDIEAGISQKQIAIKYNISKGTTHCIVKKKTYRDISCQYNFTKRLDIPRGKNGGHKIYI